MKMKSHYWRMISFSKVILPAFFFLIVTFPRSMFAQVEEEAVEEDSIEIVTIEKVKKPSIFSGRPGKSLLFSLIVPGAGQIYNKSYLRVPFVWAAVGGAGYVLINTSRQYSCLRDAYIQKIDMVPLNLSDKCFNGNKYIPFTEITLEDLEATSAAIVRDRRDEANVNRQWAIIGFSLVWLANGIDAFVDAHLKDFDIDEDLSIDIGPRIDDDPFAPMRLGIYVQF